MLRFEAHITIFGFHRTMMNEDSYNRDRKINLCILQISLRYSRAYSLFSIYCYSKERMKNLRRSQSQSKTEGESILVVNIRAHVPQTPFLKVMFLDLDS